MENLSQFVARIRSANNNICGTGFLLDEDKIITCAHVVCKALGLARDVPEKPSQPIDVDFPGVVDKKKYFATVIDWGNDQSIDRPQDWAILKLSEKAPNQGLPFAVVPTNTNVGHHFMTFGFPKGFINGMVAKGEILQQNANGWVQIESVKEVGQFVEKGFSGGPVFDEELNAVVGMIVGFTPETKGTAFMIPLSSIAKEWSELIEINVLKIGKNWHLQPPDNNNFKQARVRSPLASPWTNFITTREWHKQVAEIIDLLLSLTSQFSEVEELGDQVSKLPISANYEELGNKIKSLNYRKYFTIIDQSIENCERITRLSSSEIRRKKGRLTPDEERQKNLDSLHYNLSELRKIASSPQYGRCFFIHGGMGTGKTHFWMEKLADLEDSDSLSDLQEIILPLRFYNCQGDIDKLITLNLREATGINWPDLFTFNYLLQQFSQKHRSRDLYFSYREFRIKLVIVVDDLSHWELLQKGFTSSLMRFIRNSTRFHSVYWIITIPSFFYSSLIEMFGSSQTFFKEYAVERQSRLSYIDHWLVLDDLNKNNDLEPGVGIQIIENEKNTSLAILRAESISETTMNNLCNPLIAWTVLNLEDTLPMERAINLNFIEFIDSFFQEQMSVIVSSEENQNNTTFRPIRQDELSAFVRRTAKYLSTQPDIMLPRSELLDVVASMATSRFDLQDAEVLENCLRILTKGLIIEEHRGSVSAERPTVPTVEIHFFPLWALLIADTLIPEFSRYINLEELESKFQKIADYLCPAILEFLLLKLNKQKGYGTAMASYYSHLILKSKNLPHEPVWLAGAKADEKLQKILINRLKTYIKPNMSGRTIHSILYFLSELPLHLTSISDRFRIFHSMYKWIKPNTYDQYFLYVAHGLFKKIETPDELILCMANLSGCETMGITEELAEISVETIFALHSGSNKYEEMAQSIIKYLQLILGEYKDSRTIPEQEEGWKRYLYREFVLFHYLDRLVSDMRLEAYSLLLKVHWFDHFDWKKNGLIGLQCEREANIVLGSLYRRMQKSVFLDFVSDLVNHGTKIDKNNAFFIIWHSVKIDGREVPLVDDDFLPMLRKLYNDASVKYLREKPGFRKFYDKNLKPVH